MLAFTCEEVWGYFSKPEGSPASVHLALMPEPEELTAGITEEQRAKLANWSLLFPVREEVLRSLSVARDEEKRIGSSLEARVRLTANGDLYPLLHAYAQDLPSFFIVSEVSLASGEPDSPLAVVVERAQGEKCERCWKYTIEVGQDAEFPTLCASCCQAVREILNDSTHV